MEQTIEKKQLGQILCGGPSSYESHKLIDQKSPYLYTHDFDVYTDDVMSRHDRNIFEVKKIMSLIKDGSLVPNMLIYNTSNCFYPSYVVHHHYSFFTKILNNYIQIPTIRQFLKGCSNLSAIGAFFDESFDGNTYKSQPFIPKINSSGQVQMPEDLYFFSPHTSLLITHCLFEVQTKNGPSLCLLRLRNSSGKLQNNIRVRDFGSTISNDFMNVGYNLNGVIAQIVIQLKDEVKRNLILANSLNQLDEFTLSLQDLRRSLSIAIKYCSMRRQFPTLEGSKLERQIITYQAVSSRIIQGFSSLCAYSFLLLRLKYIPALSIYFTPLLQYSHHTILQRIIHLRQCCGGFGYMQISGHPGNIERTAFRASQKNNSDIPDRKQFLKRAHYYSGDDSLQPFYGQKIQVDRIFEFGQIFKVFILICIQMRKRKNEMSRQAYVRQFVKQAAIQAMYNFDSYGRTQKIDIITTIIQYLLTTYILDNAKFINWTYVKMEPEKYFEGIQNTHRDLLLNLAPKLQTFESILEITFMRNVILGGSDAEQFYQKVWEAAKTNKRNSPEFNSYVKQPIVQMITNNRNKGSL